MMEISNMGQIQELMKSCSENLLLQEVQSLLTCSQVWEHVSPSPPPLWGILRFRSLERGISSILRGGCCYSISLKSSLFEMFKHALHQKDLGWGHTFSQKCGSETFSCLAYNNINKFYWKQENTWMCISSCFFCLFQR